MARSSGAPHDLVIVGAGIIGLATARAFLLRHPGADVVVIDKEDRVAAHQSGRNSGVIHAGLYYAPGSEKAALCRAGRAMLLELCQEHAIPHEVCGKVVVATRTEELGRLTALHDRARANAIEARLLRRGELSAIEPHAHGVAALHVPSTGVVDFRDVCDALATDVVDRGGRLVLGQPVRAMRADGDLASVETDEAPHLARAAVNCGGLHSDELAAADAEGGARIVPFRGEFFSVRRKRDFLVRHLIYPVPDPRFPFLGAHFTRGIDGGVHAGPNAVLALGREAYDWRSSSWRLAAELVTDPRLRRLARSYWRTGGAELARSLSRRAMVHALQRLVPEIQPDDLVPAPAGIRAQLVDRDGVLADDFRFAFDPPIVHVLNAPSPAATASLAIGERIVDHISDERAPQVR